MLNLKHIALFIYYPTGLICYYVRRSEINIAIQKKVIHLSLFLKILFVELIVKILQKF